MREQVQCDIEYRVVQTQDVLLPANWGLSNPLGSVESEPERLGRGQCDFSSDSAAQLFLAPFEPVSFSDVSATASRRRIRQDHTVHSVGRLPRDFHVDSSHIWPDARATVRGLKFHSIAEPEYEVSRIERSDALPDVGV